MSGFDRKGSGTTASPADGLARAALAIALFVILFWIVPGTQPVAFLSAGLTLFFGFLLAAGRPRVLAREPLMVVVLDSLLVSLLVAGTGGGDSLFFPLYFLAALGVIRVPGLAKVAVATILMAGGYLVAVGFVDGPGALGTFPVGLGAGLVALSCVAAGYLGYGVRDLAGRGRVLSSDLAAERDQAIRAEGLVSGFGTALRTSSIEEILSWTVRTARAGCGGAYAHVAELESNHHASVFEGNTDACPSWWHPSIQGLVLSASREGGAVRSDEEIHGISGFLAVPIGAAGDGGP